MSLQRKIDYSVSLLQKVEPLALQMNESGYHLAFSGGKDSQVLYHIAKLAGVKFVAHMQLTSVDPPELMRFIRRCYTDVVLHPPKESMYKIIGRKGLPTMRMRFCCEILKEKAGAGSVTLLGIRAAESVKRSKRKEFTQGFQELSIDNISNAENLFSCVNGKDRILLSPILKWTTADVWNFIRGNSIEYCQLYDEGFHRIGCIFCPMSQKKTKYKELERYPLVVSQYKIAIKNAMNNGKYKDFSDENDVFMWWLSGLSSEIYLASKKQCKLF